MTRLTPTLDADSHSVDQEDDILGNLMPLLETPNNHAALISGMSDLLKTRGVEVSKVLDEIKVLPQKAGDSEKDNRRKKADLNMALRAALMAEGFRNVDPTHLNIVAQVVPGFGQRSGADRNANAVNRKLDREYNGVNARSLIREGITSTEDYKDLIDRKNGV